VNKKERIFMQGKNAGFIIVVCFALSSLALAQKNEFALSVGAVATSDQQTTLLGITCPVGFPNCTGPFNTSTSTGIAFEGVYTRRLFNFHIASVGVEFPILGVPSRDVTTNRTPIGALPFTVSQWSLFFTPSVQIRFLPSGRISPFFSLGGGLAHHDAASSITRGALQFGGGADFKTPLPHLAIRAEIRDFWARGFAESSRFFAVSPERLHNVFAGAGIVFKF